MTTGGTFVSTSRCTAPANVPRGRLKTSGNSEVTCSVVDNACTLAGGIVGSVGRVAEMKLSLWILIRLMCCAARAPIMGTKFSQTTTNSMEYLLLFLGFLAIARVVP